MSNNEIVIRPKRPVQKTPQFVSPEEQQKEPEVKIEPKINPEVEELRKELEQLKSSLSQQQQQQQQVQTIWKPTPSLFGYEDKPLSSFRLYN